VFRDARGLTKEHLDLVHRGGEDKSKGLTCGVCGMLGMQSYRQDDHTYNDNGHTILSTYYSGICTLRDASYPASRPEQVADAAGAFHPGAAAFGNAQEWTKE